jgi:hypothetical protein
MSFPAITPGELYELSRSGRPVDLIAGRPRGSARPACWWRGAIYYGGVMGIGLLFALGKTRL